MKTAIITDSNSGIFSEEGRELGIYVQPMPVILDGTSYFEGVDLDHQEFFRQLQAGADASTSQPAPGDVTAMFEKALKEGFDEVVCIPMSSGLSASFQTARVLAEDFDGKVQVVDNRRVSVTLHDSVLAAKKLADQGANAREIREALEKAAQDAVIFLGVDTLKYFKKNGRCTPAAALLGSALNIKPLLKCDGAKFDACAKVRGTAACKKKLIESIRETADALRSAGGKVSVGAASSYVDPKEEQAWADMVREAFPNDDFHYEALSFSVICHTGPNAFGMGVSRGI